MALKAGNYVICDIASLQESYGRHVEHVSTDSEYCEMKDFACVVIDDDEITTVRDNYNKEYLLRTGIFGVFPKEWVNESEIFYTEIESSDPIFVEYSGRYFAVDDIVVTIYSEEDTYDDFFDLDDEDYD